MIINNGVAMSTLTKISPLLSQLFADAAAQLPELEQQMQHVPEQDLGAIMSSTSQYRELYTRMKNFHLAVSPATGTLLYMLARSSNARSIIEFGTSFGVSTLHLAAALRDNGGGRLISCEFEPSKVVRARANLAAGGLDDLVEIREGDALETLANNLPDVIDLVLLDGAKGLYPAILALLEGKLRAGALIIADNADWGPEYLARVRAPEHGYLSIPFAGDVELSIWTGGNK
jgi:predicted O-methyltransferase YrrM